MRSTLSRLNPAITMVALFISILALVATAAGVGYAAGKVGTAQLKNNAITTAKIKKNAVTTSKVKKNAIKGSKVKNGSLSAADLVAEEAPKIPTLGDGGEGDCIWSDATAVYPGTAKPNYRKDRFGTVHLGGIALAADGPGGDADCNSGASGQSSDGIAFTLPNGYIPAKTQLFASGGGLLVVVGPSGFNLAGLSLPAGSVYTQLSAFLDGVSFLPAGSDVAIAKTKASGQDTGQLLRPLADN